MQPVYNSFLIKVVDKGMHIKAHLDIFSKSQVKQIIKVMLLESQKISVLGPDVYLLFDINVSNRQHAYLKPFIFKISSGNVLQLVIKKNGERAKLSKASFVCLGEWGHYKRNMHTIKVPN